MKTIEPDTLERQRIEAAQRDPAQFDALYEANFNQVYGYVARRVPTRDEAEDITSEVFHQALLGLPLFRWQGTLFVAWLLGIAAHLIARRWQRMTRQPEVATEPVDLENALEDAAADAERQAIFAQLIDRLPDDQRRVIVGRFVDQRSIREIAQQLGRSEGAVKQLQLRALENLRNQFRSRHE